MIDGDGPVTMPAGDEEDEDGLEAYDVLVELDRLEEAIDTLDELGVSDRAGVEALPASPDSVQLLQELDALGVTSRAEIEARIAALEAGFDDED